MFPAVFRSFPFFTGCPLAVTLCRVAVAAGPTGSCPPGNTPSWAYGTCRSITARPLRYSPPFSAAVSVIFKIVSCRLVFINSRPPYMNNRGYSVLAYPCFWQRPPAPTCKWWRHGFCSASRWKRYGRKGGQGNTPICPAVLPLAGKVPCLKGIHCHIFHKRRGRAVPLLTLSLFSFSISVSLSLSLVDKCPLDMMDIYPYPFPAGLFASVKPALPCVSAPPR